MQAEPRGTGDAAAAARDALAGFEGDVLVVTGDAAAITGELLGRLLETHRAEGAAATVLSFEPAEPGAYGRIVRDADGALRGDRRGARRERGRARAARGQLLDLRLRTRTSSGRRSSGSAPRTRRASST